MHLPFDDWAIATLIPACWESTWPGTCMTIYAGYALRKPILDYNAEFHMQQFHFITNRRGRQVGVEEPFPSTVNVLSWLDEQAKPAVRNHR